MPNKEIQIQVQTDSEGMINLNIPTDLINQDLQLKISFEPTEAHIIQDEELESILAKAKPASDLADYCGKLRTTKNN